MKKTLVISGVLVMLVVSTSWILLPSGHAVKKSVSAESVSVIPDDLKPVFEKSCMPCHAPGGKGMAMSVLDLSKWDKYKAEKQTKKAAAICKEVTKGSMPPKGFLASNPDAALTQEQKDRMCKWSQATGN